MGPASENLHMSGSRTAPCPRLLFSQQRTSRRPLVTSEKCQSIRRKIIRRPAYVQSPVQPSPHNSTQKNSGGGRLNARPCVVGGPPPLRFGRLFVGGRVSVDAGRPHHHHHRQEQAPSVRHRPGRRPPPYGIPNIPMRGDLIPGGSSSGSVVVTARLVMRT